MPPRSSPQRRRHEVAGGSEEDGTVEALRRRVVSISDRVGAEPSSQVLIVTAAGQHVHSDPEMQGDLGREVAAAAEPENAEPAARGDAAAPQCSVADDARAEQWRSVLVVDGVRQAIDERLLGNARVRISAVHVPSSELRCDAEIFGATATVGTAAVGARQPRHADPVTDPEAMGIRSDGIHHADDLMPGDRTRPVWWEVAFGQVQVSTADTTASDPDQHLPGPRHGSRPLHARKRAGPDRTRRVDDPGPHRDVVQAPHGTGCDLGAALQVA